VAVFRRWQFHLQRANSSAMVEFVDPVKRTSPGIEIITVSARGFDIV
jgi:hypothetical protein